MYLHLNMIYILLLDYISLKVNSNLHVIEMNKNNGQFEILSVPATYFHTSNQISVTD